MPLNIGHFITDGKSVLKMSQGTPMDEIIPRNTDDTTVQVKNIGASGPGYLHVSCMNSASKCINQLHAICKHTKGKQDVVRYNYFSWSWFDMERSRTPPITL